MSTVNDPVRLVADPGCPESQRALLQHGVNIAQFVTKSNNEEGVKHVIDKFILQTV